MAATNKAEFELATRRIYEVFTPAVAKLVVLRAGGEALNTAVRDTRVDTGRARGGWQLGVRQRPRNQTGVRLKGSTKGALSGADSNHTLTQLQTATAEYNAYDTLHVTNNVHYISYLNDGTSRFEGDHMIEKAVMRVEVVVRSLNVLLLSAEDLKDLDKLK